jgi:hypothetical protein
MVKSFLLPDVFDHCGGSLFGPFRVCTASAYPATPVTGIVDYLLTGRGVAQMANR